MFLSIYCDIFYRIVATKKPLRETRSGLETFRNYRRILTKSSPRRVQPTFFRYASCSGVLLPVISSGTPESDRLA